MERFAKALFWSAALFSLVMASLPKPPRLPGSPSDKIQHVAAFLALGILAGIAYRRTPELRLLIGLSCFGALIEVIQAIPALHRDSDPVDWIADTLAAAVAIGAVALWKRRRAVRR